MLTEQRKKQLDEIVLKMASQNAPQKDVQLIVDDFIGKFGNEQVATSQKEGNIITKAGEFLGLGALGRGIAGSVFQYTKEGKDINKLVAEGKMKPQEAEAITKPIMPSSKQVIGSAIQTAVNVGTAGLGAAKGATAGIRIAKTAGQMAGLGTIAGTGRAMEEDKGTGDIIKNAITTGVISGIVGGALKGVSEGISSIAKKAPERLYNTAIKPTLEESRKAIRYNGKTLGKELIDRGVVGSDKQLLNKSINKITENEDKLQNLLKNNNSTIKRIELVKYFDDLLTKKKMTPGLSTEVDKINQVLLEFPEEIPIKDANVIKRNLYDALRDIAFKIDPSLSTKKEAMKVLASGIRNEIENKTGGVAKTYNQELSVYGRLFDRITDKFARANRNQILSVSNLGSLGVGGVTGGIPGALVGIAAKNILGSTTFKTGSALLLNALNKIPTDTAGKISKTAILNLIKGLTND